MNRSMNTALKLMEYLKEQGNILEVSHKDLITSIRLVIGTDKVTVMKYVALLKEWGFLKQNGAVYSINWTEVHKNGII